MSSDSPSFNENVFIPGPSFHVDLAALDALHPMHYARRLIIFRCASPAQRNAQLAALEAGLRTLVARCPLLGGIVTPPPSNAPDNPDWRTIVPGPGLELIVRDLRAELPSLAALEADGFPVAQFPYALLMPIPADLTSAVPYAACKVQMSAIEGGTLVTFAMSHSVGDGTGANELMRILCEGTRRAQDEKGEGDLDVKEVEAEAVVGMDRSVLRNLKSPTPFKIEDHPAYMLKSTRSESTQASEPHPFEATSPEVPVTLHVSAPALARLKAEASTLGAPPISTHDALTALLWRSVLLIRSRRSPAAARFLSDSPDALASIFLPSDGRRHLGLPPTYVGNAVYQLTAALPFRDLLLIPSTDGLRKAASAVRRAIRAVTPERVVSCMVETNARWLDWQFVSTAASTGVAMGTGWTGGPAVYEHDWGTAFGGAPVRYRVPSAAMCWVFPKLPDGSAELVVGVMPQEVEMLKGEDCFGRYL